MISIVVFAIGSVPIIWLSRRSFLQPTAHGFSRFFAFEAIFALIVINGPHWFEHAFGARQFVPALSGLGRAFVVQRADSRLPRIPGS